MKNVKGTKEERINAPAGICTLKCNMKCICENLRTTQKPVIFLCCAGRDIANGFVTRYVTSQSHPIYIVSHRYSASIIFCVSATAH